ncbi:serine protease [Lithospermum erythrorhizon]|uniref:Serine protease n=1 Tax=Lithospermum erythrorhizon TaxID=34254 RepID=A0AAV3RB98_LITER
MAQQSHSSVESSTSETQKITAPYGTWKSPLTADLVSCSDKRLNGCAVDAHGRLFCLEGRPIEGGRPVLVKSAEDEGGEDIDITPKEFAERTKVQDSESGGAFCISGDTIVFSNCADQRLYRQSTSSTVYFTDLTHSQLCPQFYESISLQRLCHDVCNLFSASTKFQSNLPLLS